jgi:hypothetical protein
LARGAHDVLDVVVVLAVLVDRVLRVDAHALEVLVHDEVDDAADGVGAVNGRGAAGQHVDAFDEAVGMKFRSAATGP